MVFNVLQDFSDSEGSSDDENLFPDPEEVPVPKPGFSMEPLRFLGSSYRKTSANASEPISHSLPYVRIPKSLPKHSNDNIEDAGLPDVVSETRNKSGQPQQDHSASSTATPEEPTSLSAPASPVSSHSPHLLSPEPMALDDDLLFDKENVPPKPLLIGHDAGSDLIDIEDGKKLDLESDCESERETDHSKLCPWCDDVMPDNPSKGLLRLIEEVKRLSKSQPRPGNRFGLRAQIPQFAGVCLKHRYESEDLLLARQEGWPEKIDWNKVKQEIGAMEPGLKSLCEDHQLEDGSRYRDRFLFWTEVAEKVEEVGLSKFIKSEMNFFDRYLVGYYGQIGYTLIDSEIKRMFPRDYLQQMPLEPLNAAVFHRFILIPSVAMQLIMLDRGIESWAAIDVLRASSRYGNMTFPLDEEESEGKMDNGAKRSGKKRKDAENGKTAVTQNAPRPKRTCRRD
ncbi:hypothetical protein D9758_017300 [Tetrapyrgos nigripes]|uniref:Restriction of telomere capping protein 4 n=1 Tax=Tetrapyrgos nigripes TaxID=182062 RepID=A0A8H5C0T6_9AGAR|nr:hypothetical protein D9758_017300 [Tetrapyrgos nigripes]